MRTSVTSTLLTRCLRTARSKPNVAPVRCCAVCASRLHLLDPSLIGSICDKHISVELLDGQEDRTT